MKVLLRVNQNAVWENVFIASGEGLMLKLKLQYSGHLM